MEVTREEIIRRRMHGLYLSRRCEDIVELSRRLLGLHCWFHRNVAFSAVIRGAGLAGWRDALTKTWLYRGTLHGVAYDQLPLLLAIHPADAESTAGWMGLSPEELEEVCGEVVRLMEDGVYSRAQLRLIYAERYDRETVERLFSPWGGVFVYLARQGRVSFRSMTSRDFDLISAEPSLSPDEALDILLDRFFEVYGPATVADAAWFFGLDKRYIDEGKLERFQRLEYEGDTYYCAEAEDMDDIPRVTLLSGFDPYIVSYQNRAAALPEEYRKAVILKSGICLPTVAVDGRVAGLWNIKKGVPTVEFFGKQPKRVADAAFEMAADMAWRVSGQI